MSKLDVKNKFIAQFNYGPTAKPTLDEIATAMAEVIWKLTDQEAWHEVGSGGGEPAFQNAWVNFGAGDASAAFFKDSFNMIHLKGLIKDGTIGAVPCATLPGGYRPPKAEWFAVPSNFAFGGVKINSNGQIHCRVGNNAWLSLAGITFRAA